MLRLFDSMARQVEDVRPGAGRLLTVYSCGPTVYRYAHVGNLRTFLLPDLIERVAEHHGLRTLLVQNITDVGHLRDDIDIDPHGEDKVLAQARAEGKSALELARQYEQAFHGDLAALNIRPASACPRASEAVPLMMDLTARLIDLDFAYRAPDGSVFFDARAFPSYGALSGNRLAELRPGHRFPAHHVDPGKRFHADWALWKAAGPTRQMTWESPWGIGYPGWHIECSAMSLHHIGESIDLHLGGIDLRFPHHESERAQSNAVVGHEVVGRWVHGEHLLFEGRKMAKSSGNLVVLADVAERGYDPLALRLAFLGHRYRQQMNLTWDEIAAADRTLARWRQKVATWAEQPSGPTDPRYVRQASAAMDADLDTPAAVVALRNLEKDPNISDGSKFETFALLDQLLGLDLARDVGRPRPEPELPDGAPELLARRARAREAKDWEVSDRLRAELAALGVTVTDTPDGQTWTVHTP